MFGNQVHFAPRLELWHRYNRLHDENQERNALSFDFHLTIL
jgi:hypothetical protein